MTIFLVGVSHKTAPLELRERLAIEETELPAALSTLVDRTEVGEASIVSTCNRVEIIASGERADSGISRVCSFLEDWHGLSVSDFGASIYRRSHRDAVHHLFRVASSLDSMVVGEPQILGQVREAYRTAVDAGTVGDDLEPLFQRAFAVAKRVRTETAVGASAVSISYVAVELAKKIFDSLTDKSAMLIGAGEMAELALRHFKEGGARKLYVSNRTSERSEDLAERFTAEAVPFDELAARFGEADIVVCSTAAPSFVLSRDDVKRALEGRRNKPLLLIDISVPRQIDPAAGEIDNVYLFDLDDLHRVVESNLKEREREAVVAEAIVENEVLAFLRRFDSELGPTVSELKGHLNELAAAEYEKQRRRLGPLTDEQDSAIRNILLPSIINKIAHPMITHMREEERHVSIWRRIFRLGPESDK